MSLTSAERFAARVRARRRRRALIVVAVMLVVGTLAWATLKSPWATVQRIEVVGTLRVSAAEVRAEAEPEVGHPLLLARTADVAARVDRQRLVRSVLVERHWPGRLLIRVTERVPVAAIPVRSGLALVDVDGVVIERVAKLPVGLPKVAVKLGAAGVQPLRGCLQVLRGLPPELSKQVSAIGADSADGIWLRLKARKASKRSAGSSDSKGSTVVKQADRARVEWGNASDTERKARVLIALLPQRASSYDVRSPDTPAVRRK